MAAPCRGIPAEPIDMPKWPIHAAGWLHPEAPPSAPSWSGLTIERRNRIPSPDLLRFHLPPLDRVADPDDPPEALTRTALPAIPESSLAPLGWDPRAVCPKKESR
jgi:hypothetical protein